MEAGARGADYLIPCGRCDACLDGNEQHCSEPKHPWDDLREFLDFCSKSGQSPRLVWHEMTPVRRAYWVEQERDLRAMERREKRLVSGEGGGETEAEPSTVIGRAKLTTSTVEHGSIALTGRDIVEALQRAGVFAPPEGATEIRVTFQGESGGQIYELCTEGELIVRWSRYVETESKG